MINNFWGRRAVNVELTYKCSLMCPACPRQTQFKARNEKIKGEELSIENFTKLAKFFNYMEFCGQFSDPLHHSKFHEILDITNRHDIREVSIHTAVSLPPIEFYREAWKIRPDATWVFGIDGMPEDSNKYRVNQDGQKLFDIMLECAKVATAPPVWQYIIFSYNEKDIAKAQEIADKNNLRLKLIKTSRWDGYYKKDENDYKPNNDNALPASGREKGWKSKKLIPDCFGHLPFGTNRYGRLLPCCKVDDIGNYGDSMYYEMLEASKISDYDSIEDMLNTDVWKKFFENLKNNKGMNRCHDMCSCDSNPNMIIKEKGKGEEIV